VSAYVGAGVGELVIYNDSAPILPRNTRMSRMSTARHRLHRTAHAYQLWADGDRLGAAECRSECRSAA